MGAVRSNKKEKEKRRKEMDEAGIIIKRKEKRRLLDQRSETRNNRITRYSRFLLFPAVP